ncbi:hypothetical protein QZH56_17610 [Streptomyces olivoreticuli]|uniref:hypothetical protein n=1 Tax=Streptomyces olivoreticuli TaxID=68246 RepID=UPI00265965D9|nr:hypothetical protein [Streptomyces olivoreticuli]WKK27796.1 hypothetical protein QZH56_17610 [Streptomyces olivoreticuli]
MIVTEQNTPKKRSCVPVADLRIHGDAVRALMMTVRMLSLWLRTRSGRWIVTGAVRA